MGPECWSNVVHTSPAASHFLAVGIWAGVAFVRKDENNTPHPRSNEATAAIWLIQYQTLPNWADNSPGQLKGPRTPHQNTNPPVNPAREPDPRRDKPHQNIIAFWCGDNFREKSFSHARRATHADHARSKARCNARCTLRSTREHAAHRHDNRLPKL